MINTEPGMVGATNGSSALGRNWIADGVIMCIRGDVAVLLQAKERMRCHHRRDCRQPGCRMVPLYAMCSEEVQMHGGAVRTASGWTGGQYAVR